MSLMRDAESPRTAFESLLIGSEKASELFLMDNGCNVQNFALAREPEHFAAMCVLIDGHYCGHTNCSQNCNSGEHPELANSSLAAQKYATLRRLVSQLTYKSLRTALQYVCLVHERNSAGDVAQRVLLRSKSIAYASLPHDGCSCSHFCQRRLI